MKKKKHPSSQHDQLKKIREECFQTLEDINAFTNYLTDPTTSPANPPIQDVQTSVSALKVGIGRSADVIFRPLGFSKMPNSTLVFIKDRLSKKELAEQILRPLFNVEENLLSSRGNINETLNLLERTIAVDEIKKLQTLPDVTAEVISGNAILLLDDMLAAFSLSISQYKGRSVGKTTVENVIMGPLDAFVEDLETNLALVRQRVRDETFQVEILQIGSKTQTKVALLSIGSRVNPSVLARLKLELSNIHVDAVVSSGHLAQMLNPGVISIFPTHISTERPDRTVMALLDGRIAVIVNNTPFVLLLPTAYLDFFRAVEDRYVPWVPATAVRILRTLSNHITALGPAIYIILAGYNPSLMVPKFQLALASARALVPYSPLVEMLLVLLLTEILVEATVRSPKVIGNALPIVGGIIIGNVLNSTHLANQLALVIAALATVAQFTSTDPSIQTVLRINKYWFVVWTGFFGAMGLMIAAALELGYMASLESVGVPYFAPAAPFRLRETLTSKLVLPSRWEAGSPVKRTF